MSTPLTEEQRQLLRLRLLDEQQRLLREIAELVEAQESLDKLGEFPHSGSSNHIADKASDTFDLEMNVTLDRNLHTLLTEVERALHKFDNGSYGICDECLEPIPWERLEALPHANLCVHCKTKRERFG